MVSTRTLRIFNLYDVLGVFFPGTTLLVGAYILLPGIPDPSSLIQYLGIIVSAFAIGHLLQSYSSFPTGDLKVFDATIQEVQNPSDLAEEWTEDPDTEPPDGAKESIESSDEATDDEASSSDEDSEQAVQNGSKDDSFDPIRSSPGWYLYLIYSFVGPIIGLLRTPNAGGIEDLRNPSRVWRTLNEDYQFEAGRDRYDEMQQVISSRIDDPASPARSYRFQAIRNFHRGTWLAMWILFAVLVGTTAVTWATQYFFRPMIHPLAESYLFSTLPLWLIGVAGIIGVLAFWWQTLQFERLFIRFLITDYVVLLNQNEQVERVQLLFED